jgi:signal transduction histidine kinase/ActR/RegA family two-component response regulator
VPTVLIVDDQAMNRELVRLVLTSRGHVTMEAGGGAEALQVMRAERPDVVLADVVMPGMDGYELARAIRADDELRTVPVLFYTAKYLETELKPFASAVGVDHIVQKRGNLSELVAAVDDALGLVPPEPADEVDEVDEVARSGDGDAGSASADAQTGAQTGAHTGAHTGAEIGSGLAAGLDGDEPTPERLRDLNAKLFEKVSELEEGARLHQMVEAIVAVGDDPSLPAIMRRIAAAGFSLVGARYSAMVRSATTSRAADWAGVGSDPDAEQAIARWARGERIELDFTIVPVRIGGEVFGSLVVVPRDADAFGPAEVNLLQTLARAAGVAIANSQLYDDARRRQEWLTASAEVTSTMLAADPLEASRLVAAGARRVLGASSSWITVPHEHNTLRVDASDGAVADALTGVVIPLSDSILFTEVAAGAQPIVIANAATDQRTHRLLAAFDLAVGPLLAVPLHASGQSFGVLCIGNPPDSASFSALDVEMARAFAGRAAQTLEFARSEEHKERLSLAEDRNRIARDLHDVVIQRLFGVGLRLEQLRNQQPDATAGPLGEVIDDLDRTIDEIRNTIFSLRADEGDTTTLRGKLLEIVEPATFLLTFPPRLRVEGPIDRAVPDNVHPHLLATLGEALSNTVRHAHASSVDVLVRVDGDGLTLQVTDNGRGLPKERHESGLANLRRRAEELDGWMQTSRGPDGTGTMITWFVPIRETSHGDVAEQPHAATC